MVNGAVIEFLPAFLRVIEFEFQTVAIRVSNGAPPEGFVGSISIAVLGNCDIVHLANEPMLHDVTVAEEKCLLKIGFESPVNIDGHGHDINQLESLPAPSFRLDPVDHLALTKQVLVVRFNGCRMDR